jgi:hypothetical protein
MAEDRSRRLRDSPRCHGGSVRLDGSFSAPTCTLVAGSGGSASCSIDYSETSFAPHKIYANYLGDADHVPSNSAATVIFDT